LERKNVTEKKGEKDGAKLQQQLVDSLEMKEAGDEC